MTCFSSNLTKHVYKHMHVWFTTKWNHNIHNTSLFILHSSYSITIPIIKIIENPSLLNKNYWEALTSCFEPNTHLLWRISDNRHPLNSDLGGFCRSKEKNRHAITHESGRACRSRCDGMHVDLDRQIKHLMACNPLPEVDVMVLCDQERVILVVEWNFQLLKCSVTVVV